ncbi:MAG TPA: hypothetical protein PLY32_04775 [Salinivirgaceae bacterium]|nr:hypothetical protein [Salinivirgaceae bacterium]HQA76415.1 hypothetical protein [Salinivirgaceae bacterium]
MKKVLKSIGLVLIFIGVVIVGYTSIGTIQENTGLWVGGIIIFVGLITFILTNRYIE